MKVRLKDNLIVVTAESEDEQLSAAAWASVSNGHAFVLQVQDDQTFRMIHLGHRDDACREPINVTSNHPDPIVQLISNFAHTPFTLDGQNYASVEGFWQGLKFSDLASRLAIAELHGHEARKAGFDAPVSHVFEYLGKQFRVGTFDHWQLMKAACFAKFSQHEASRQAMLSTRDRPLTHKTREDSRTIPGVILCDIWMKIRKQLRLTA